MGRKKSVVNSYFYQLLVFLWHGQASWVCKAVCSWAIPEPSALLISYGFQAPNWGCNPLVGALPAQARACSSLGAVLLRNGVRFTRALVFPRQPWVKLLYFIHTLAVMISWETQQAVLSSHSQQGYGLPSCCTTYLFSW